MDIFRREYKELSNDQKAYVDLFKYKAQELFDKFMESQFLDHDQRCMSLAKTNLEQAVMWAVKAITR